MSTLFLGVDGGGAETEFICIDERGTVMAQAVTGTSYHPQVGLTVAEKVRQHVVALLRREALQRAG